MYYIDMFSQFHAVFSYKVILVLVFVGNLCVLRVWKLSTHLYLGMHSLDLTSADKFICVSKIPITVFLNFEKVLKQTSVHLF